MNSPEPVEKPVRSDAELTTDSQIMRAQRLKLLQLPETSTTAGALGGIPVATGVAWFIDNLYLKPRGLVLDPVGATFLGGIGALLLGELWLIWTRFKIKHLS
jgi:hypothetical protein